LSSTPHPDHTDAEGTRARGLSTRVRQRLRFLRAAAPGLPPEALRAHERHRRGAWIALTSMGARAVGIAVNILLVPITLKYLGDERFGMWMTVTSFIQMLSFTDLGLGNGLLNRISESYGRGDREATRRAVSSAFAMLCGIAALIATCVLVAYPHVDWRGLLNLKSRAAAVEAGPATLVVVASFLISIPLGVISRIQAGFQEAYETNVHTAAGKFAALLAVLAGIHLHADLPVLLACLLGPPVLAIVINGLRIFTRRHRDLFPSWRKVSRSTASKLLHQGLQFMVLQVCVALVYSSDNIILAHVAGASAVTPYSVVTQLFAFPIMLLTMAIGPLWPAYTEAMTRGDHAWIRKTFRRSITAAIAFATVTSIALILVGPTVIRVWTHGLTRAPTSLLVAMGAWNVCLASGTAIAMLLNGINALRIQVFTSVGVLVVGTVFRVLGCRYAGGVGLAWGTTVGYLLIAMIPISLEVIRRLRQMKGPISAATDIALP